MCRNARRIRMMLLTWATLLGLAVSWGSAHVFAAASSHTAYLPAVLNGSGPLSAAESQALDLINQQRRAAGCAPAKLNPELTLAAETHSQDMGQHNFFSHVGSDGSTFSVRAQRAHYAYFASGEVIGAGYTSGASVVDGWMKSAGHRAIILTCANTDIGIGMVNAPGTQWGYYWTGVFGQH